MALQVFFQAHPLWLLGAAAVLGLLVGSFINVLVYRLPLMMQRDWEVQAREVLGLPAVAGPEPLGLALPRSRCPHCGHPIGALENIPVLSWLWLRGRCRTCQAPISVRYPLVELGSAVLSAWTAWHFGPGWPLLAFLVLGWALLALALIDLDCQLLPDDLVLPLLWLGLVLNGCGLLQVPLADALWGAVAGYLGLWSVYWLFRLLTGKEGMGYGDFKLLALLGAWGGWQILPLTLLLSALVGAVVGTLVLRLKRQGLDTPIPFGPFLIGAGWIALLWGDQMTARYLQLAGF